MSDVTDAIDAINGGAHAYTAPGCVGPSDGTVASLTSTDQIILVVLPTSAGNAADVARQISSATGGKKIIGLVVGNQTTGYAPRFQPGVAADLMSRASSVTNTPQQALTVYVNKVHEYQRTNAGQDAMRETVTVTSTGAPVPSGPNPGLVVGGVLAAVVLLAVVSLVARRWLSRHVSAADKSGWADRSITAQALVEWGEITPPLDASELPRDAKGSFRQVQSWVRDIASQWDEIVGTDVATGLRELLFSTVPRTLRLWNDLPDDLRTKVRNGVTPEQLIVRQFAAIETAVSQVRDAAFDGTLDELQIESVFAQTKFGKKQLQIG